MPIDVNRGYVPGLRDARGEPIVGQANAGTIHRTTPEGIWVYMYNDTPGVFFAEHGMELPVEMARAAGYDVETLLRERKKRESLAALHLQVEAEYASTKIREVVLERDDYSVVHLGSGMYNIEFKDGTVMNPQPLPEDIALRVFDTLAPEAAV